MKGSSDQLCENYQRVELVGRQILAVVTVDKNSLRSKVKRRMVSTIRRFWFARQSWQTQSVLVTDQCA